VAGSSREPSVASTDHNEEDVQNEQTRGIDRAQDAIVLFDGDAAHTVRGMSAGAEALFGYTSGEMMERGIELLLPGVVLPSIDASEQSAARHVRRLVHGRRKDGWPLVLEASFTALSGTAEGCGRVCALLRDAQDAQRLHDEWEGERLALIGIMASKLAHEISNPLQSIVLNLDLVRDTVLAEQRISPRTQEAVEFLTSAQSQIQRIHSVVAEYLQFSRAPVLHMEPTELDDVIRRHIDVIAPDLSRRRLHLTLDLGAGDMQVVADENRLWQAMLPLIRNGIEAMTAGGTLHLTTRVRDGRVECEIHDTGCGMSAEVMQNMFRPFYSTKPGGTGLGMALARQVVQEHGGEIRCESVPGQGTRVRISFPPAASPPADGREERTPIAEGTAQNG
jgi:signal transduction histidine kinase